MTLKTTPIIDEINHTIATVDTSNMHRLAIRAMTNDGGLTHIDYMALGRAQIAHKSEFRESWNFLIRPFMRVDGPHFLSMNIGTIAARVERGDLVHTYYPATGPKRHNDLTEHFLAISHVAAKYHPDADVRGMAQWAADHLAERAAKRRDIIPE